MCIVKPTYTHAGITQAQPDSFDVNEGGLTINVHVLLVPALLRVGLTTFAVVVDFVVISVVSVTATHADICINNNCIFHYLLITSRRTVFIEDNQRSG